NHKARRASSRPPAAQAQGSMTRSAGRCRGRGGGGSMGTGWPSFEQGKLPMTLPRDPGGAPADGRGTSVLKWVVFVVGGLCLAACLLALPCTQQIRDDEGWKGRPTTSSKSAWRCGPTTR